MTTVFKFFNLKNLKNFNGRDFVTIKIKSKINVGQHYFHKIDSFVCFILYLKIKLI